MLLAVSAPKTVDSYVYNFESGHIIALLQSGHIFATLQCSIYVKCVDSVYVKRVCSVQRGQPCSIGSSPCGGSALPLVVQAGAAVRVDDARLVAARRVEL